jgi:hypothetical protein
LSQSAQTFAIDGFNPNVGPTAVLWTFGGKRQEPAVWRQCGRQLIPLKRGDADEPGPRRVM